MQKKPKHRPPSQRQLRVGEEIRHVLAGVFLRGECYDPDVTSTPITVSEVRISPDLKNATAYVMPLGGKNLEKVMAALDRNASIFRKFVSDEMNLRYAPRIHFRVDNSFEEAFHIEKLLRTPKVAQDLEKK